MSELIEKRDAYHIIKDMVGLVRRDVLMDAYDNLKKLPTIDAVPVVRCGECKWYKEGYDIDGKWFSRCNGSVRTYGHTTPDWFCADGERSET